MDDNNKETMVSSPTEPVLPSIEVARNVSTTSMSPVEMPQKAPAPTEAKINTTYSGIEGNNDRINMTYDEILATQKAGESVMPSVVSKDVNVINPNDAAKIRQEAQAMIDAQKSKKDLNIFTRIKNLFRQQPK